MGSSGEDFLIILSDGLTDLKANVNQVFSSYEPITLIGGTALVAYGIHYVVVTIPKDGIYAGAKRLFFKGVKKIPFIKKQIDEEVAKAEDSLSQSIQKLFQGDNEECIFVTKLPWDGIKGDELLEKVTQYLKLGYSGPDEGLVSGALYHGGPELTKLNAKVYEMSSWSNTLHADVFPGVCKMEAEVVRMVAEMFHGDLQSCGTVTAGGTESILLAVKAYRDWAIAERGITNPEILVPITAHSSFEKASMLLNIRIKFVPINKKTFAVDIRAMRKMISKNTIMLVGSAPAFPHGCMDDIRAISELGLQFKIPVHVDACLGGFLIAFMSQAGYELPLFDFQLVGVTSISADTHKYGFAPKGSSVLLFREKKFKHYQYFLHTDWPGGLYASPTLAGSRPGALIAVCWTTMLYFGTSGYVDITRKIIKTARYILEKLKEIDGIDIMGDPEVSVIALESQQFDIYRLLDAMKTRGWVLNALQFPPSIHFCLSYNQTEPGVAEKFVQDMREAVGVLMKNPGGAATGVAAIYGSSQTVPDRSLVGDIAAIYMDKLCDTDFISKNSNSDTK